MRVERQIFGTLPDGSKIFKYKLSNNNGLTAVILNLGGILQQLLVPDRNGKLNDVVPGYDTLDGYLKNPAYFGAIIGRYANRIANAHFELNGNKYLLAKNNNGQHLHGGKVGFDKVLWNIETVAVADAVAVKGEGDDAVEKKAWQHADFLRLSHKSKHLEEGYPGNLDVRVHYSLTDSNELIIEYFAKTDQDTIVNFTSHPYFNLSGDFSKTVHEHELQINADSYLPVNEYLIPTGKFEPVSHSVFDFRNRKKMGLDIEKSDPQLIRGNGYDHCFVIKTKKDEPAAIAFDPDSGRKMTVYTDQPGLQLYTGNYLAGIKGKNKITLKNRTGFCLETQHFPDSPNQSHFPSTILRKDEKFYSKTVYRFGEG